MASTPSSGPRLSGPPPSANGASSFHLRWEMPDRPLREVSADIEVVEMPRAPVLYFWALQADFATGRHSVGAGHFGLQHHPQYPGSGAVNWGGYDRSTGQVLAGSGSELPSALGNPNTFDYPWRPGVGYRYRIQPGDAGWWWGTITDRVSGIDTVVRRLRVNATHLLAPTVWSEVFADCDAPSVTVRWSNFEAITPDGDLIRPSALHVNYQREADGGCSNTNSSVDATRDGPEARQTTSTTRTTPQGARLVW